jgi:NADH-quinone oxidoreductase subunit E
LEEVSQRLQIPLTRIYYLATFYRAFSLTPRGRHLVTVCTGTACHVKGAASILNTMERELKVKAGETTSDKEYTLETVNCLGSCAQAPLVVIDGAYHGKMLGTKVLSLLKGDKKDASKKS